jgi:ketopantoate reductase
MRMSQHVVDDLVKPIMLEIIATAKAAGVELPDDVVDKQIRLDPADEGDFLPSMGQDAVKVCSLFEGGLITDSTFAGKLHGVGDNCRRTATRS